MKPLLRDIAPKVEGDCSQFGEGSIISEILDRLDIHYGLTVEFGAGDGFHLSNTRHLWDARWRAVMIEADPALYPWLVDNAVDYAENVVTIEATVTPDNVNDFVYADAAVVSIDVDGDDFAILCAMDAQPNVLCVEHHPMIPAHISMVGGPAIGCSALALKEWGEANGYTIVAMTHCNTIMVPDVDAKTDFADVDTDFLHMFDPSGVTWVLSNVKTGDFSIEGPWPFGRGGEEFHG